MLVRVAVGVFVRVAVAVGVLVREGVAVGPVGVFVRVAVGPAGVFVRVAVAVAVLVAVGVAVAVEVAVGAGTVGVFVGATPPARSETIQAGSALSAPAAVPSVPVLPLAEPSAVVCPLNSLKRHSATVFASFVSAAGGVNAPL